MSPPRLPRELTLLILSFGVPDTGFHLPDIRLAGYSKIGATFDNEIKIFYFFYVSKLGRFLCLVAATAQLKTFFLYFGWLNIEYCVLSSVGGGEGREEEPQRRGLRERQDPAHQEG